MPNDESSSSSRDQWVNEAIAAYLNAVDAGLVPDLEEFIAEHGDIKAELEAFFADRDQFDLLAQPLRPTSPQGKLGDETLPASEQSTNTRTIASQTWFGSSVATRVRYFGDYELLEEIARGGMGVVYKARQTSLNRVVALKMILAGQLASQEDVQRFHVEAEAAANLDHPGIVPIFEVGEHEGQHYFSMAFVEGESLAEKLNDGPLPPRAAAEYTLKIAAAMSCAHERGVVHRDLKPGNILIDENGQPRVTDFGLAKRIEAESDLTASGQVLGTPSYMPPEQASGSVEEVNKLADIYSLGAVLYSLLTGRPPFQADNPLDTLLQVLEREPVSPRILNPNVPQDLETICLKCLEKDRPRRYASAQELGEELRRFLDGEPIVARPISRPARAWRWCRRNPVVATLSVGVALALVVGTLVSAYFAIESGRNASNLTVALAGQKTATALANTETDRARELATKLATSLQRQKQATKLAEERTAIARSETERAEWRLYANQIARAQLEWNDGAVGAAWKSLNACRWDFRGWEHDYLYTLFNSHQLTLRGHVGHVQCVAFSPDGRRIVSGSSATTLKIWDAVTGREMLHLEGHKHRITSVAFSPDNSRVISTSEDNTVKVWNADTGRETLTIKAHLYGVWSAAFSPDGQQLVSGGYDGTLKLWDAGTGQEVRAFVDARKSGFVHSVAFSPDGERIVSGHHDSLLRVWNVETGQRTLDLQGHTRAVRSVAFSTDGRQIVSGSDDGTLKLWNAEMGQPLATLNGHTQEVLGVAFSPDGQRIVSGSRDGTIRVWHVETGRQLLVLQGHTSAVSSVAFSPDGGRIVSGSNDSTVKVWDVETREEQDFHGHTQWVQCSAFSPDGQQIVTASRDVLKVWNVETREEVLTIAERDPFTCVATETGRLTLTLKGHLQRVQSVAFASTLVVRKEVDLKVWDAESGKKLQTLEGHTGIINAVAYSPDGKLIVSGSQDGTLRVWDTQTGEELLILKGHVGNITSVAFSPDGLRIASGGSCKTLKLWNAEQARKR